MGTLIKQVNTNYNLHLSPTDSFCFAARFSQSCFGNTKTGTCTVAQAIHDHDSCLLTISFLFAGSFPIKFYPFVNIMHYF